MANFGIAAPAAWARGSGPGPLPSLYHAPVKTGHPGARHGFNHRAASGPRSRPESHSP
jgi:hypothetical protein